MPTLRVLPDADRVEQALVDDARAHGFVDATGTVSISWLVEACEPARWLKRTPVTPLAARLLVTAAARALGPDAFGPRARDPSFARSAWELVQQLKLQDATPADFERALDALGGERPRLRQLLALWREYERLLEQHQAADRGDLLRAAADRLAQELPPRLASFTRVEVHHLHDLPPARARLLIALAATCHRLGKPVKITLPAAGNPQVDALVNEAFAGLERHAQELDLEAWPEVPNAPLSWIGGALFGEEPPGRAAPPLTAISVATPRDEARELATRVRALLDGGVAPEAVAIVFRDLGEDAEALVEALEEVGVPARVRLGMPLGATAVGRLALRLPELVDDEFPIDGVLAVLESRYAPHVSAGAPDAAQWFGLAGLRDDRLGAEGARGAYEVRLGALEKRLRSSSEKALVRDLATAVKRLVEAGRLLKPTDTALGFLRAWRKLLERLGLEHGLRGQEHREAEGTALGRAVERALARDQAAGEALVHFGELFEEALTTSGLGNQPLTRREFVRLLEDAARDVNLQARGPRSGSVRVMEVRAIAGLRFEHLFVGGLVDGRFPGRPPPLPLITEEERRELNTAARQRLFRLGSGEGGFFLPLRQAEDRLLFHLALCAGTHSVTLSRARFEAGGRELNASPFLDELHRVVRGFEERTLTRVAVAPLDTVRGPADFRARVALEALSEPGTRLSAPSPLGHALWSHFRDQPWLHQASNAAAMEKERLDFFTRPTAAEGPFSGDLSAPNFAPLRELHFGFDRANAISVSALGDYGNCAFAGWLSHVLGLAAVEEQGEEPDASTRGTFWHLVFEKLMPRMKERGWLGKPVRELPQAELEAVIDVSIDEAAKKAEESKAVGHPQLWRLGREKARRMVRRVLFSESQAQPFSDAGWLPSEVELSFGKESAPLEGFKEVAVRAGSAVERDVFVTGKIDRLDGGAGGAGVVDYKSKKHEAPGLARSALLVSDFQLPIYVLAVQQALGASQADAAWLYLGDHKVQKLSGLLEGKQTVDELMATDAAGRAAAQTEGKKNLANGVHALAGRLRHGDVGARPQDCRLCPFRRVCRISQRRLSEEL